MIECDECTCLYIHCMSVYGYSFVWTCELCLPVIVWWTCVVFVYMYEKMLYCLMAPGKISCGLTGSPSLNKVFELNWIEYIYSQYMECKNDSMLNTNTNEGP